jgi:replicative DNA helicase
MDYIKKADFFTMKNVSSIGEYVKELDPWLNGEGSIAGLELPFDKLNNKLNGFKAEDLIILSGDAGVGKTTFCLNLLYQFIKQGKKCLGFFLEGKILYYIMRMMSMETRKSYKDLRNDLSLWENVKNNFTEYPMYFYSGSQADLDTAKLKEMLLAAVQLYDIDFVMIDNLQKFVRPDKDVVTKTANAVSILKDLAVDLKIPILLIAHITKMEKDQKRVTMHDAKFSSTIYQDADVYLTIWNNKKEKDIEDNLIVTIEKNRMGEGGVDIPTVFEKDVGIYRERILELEPVKNFSESTKKVNKNKAFTLNGLEESID